MKTLLHSLVIVSLLVLAGCSGGGSKADFALIPVEINNDMYGYMNEKGEIEITAQYQSANMFHDGLALVSTKSEDSGNKYGFIDKTGVFKIAPIYKSATNFSDGVAWVVEPAKYPVAIDKSGKELFSMATADVVMEFSEGLAAFSSSTEGGETRWGYVDKSGKTVIPSKFLSVGAFVNGVALSSDAQGKVGLIDKKGEVVIKCQFDAMYTSSLKNFYVVQMGEKYGVCDKKGTIVIPCIYENIREDGDMFMVKQDGKFGWVDTKGKSIIIPQFASANAFLDQDFTAIAVGNKMGIINKKGIITLNPQYAYVSQFFGKGLALARLDSKSGIGLINDKGEYVSNPNSQITDLGYDFQNVSAGVLYKGWISSDFFDFEALTNKFVATTGADNFRGSPNTLTYGLLKPNLKAGEFSMYGNSVTVKGQDKMSPHVVLESTQYVFSTTLSSRSFSYYDNSFSTSENTEASIKKITYTLKLNDKAYGRGDEIGKAIAEKICTKYTGSSTVGEDKKRSAFYVNTDFIQFVVTYRSSSITVDAVYEDRPMEDPGC